MIARPSPLLAPLLLLLAVDCWAYPDGAPLQACSALMPSHGAEPQKVPFPYRVTVSPNSIQPGDRVTMTLSPMSQGIMPIKGFFVQARKAESPIATEALGRFVSIDPQHKAVNCSSSSASGITHRNNADKEEVMVTWQSPGDLGSDVVFRMTVVLDRVTFWVAVQSQSVVVVTSNARGTVTPPPPPPPPGTAAKPAGGRGSASSAGAWSALVGLVALAALLRPLAQ